MVIGGFGMIAHDYVRATEDIDLLVPKNDRNDNALGSLEVAEEALPS